MSDCIEKLESKLAALEAKSDVLAQHLVKLCHTAAGTELELQALLTALVNGGIIRLEKLSAEELPADGGPDGSGH